MHGNAWWCIFCIKCIKRTIGTSMAIGTCWIFTYFRKWGLTILSLSFRNFNSWEISRVNWSITEYLSTQGRLDPRGGLCCLWCSNKTWTPSPGACDTLTVIKNRLEMRKLQPSKVKGIKNSKKQTIEHYQNRFLNTQKISCMLLCCY